MRERWKQLWEISPAFLLFLGFFAGCLGRSHGWPFWILCCIGAVLALSLRVSCAGRIWSALCAGLLPLLGFFRMAYGESASGQSYMRCLPREGSGGRFRAVLVSTPLGGAGPLSEWDSGRGIVVGELRCLETLSTGGIFQEVRGRVVLQVMDPEERGRLRALPPGSVVEGRGAFLSVPSASDPVHGFYGEYLMAKGVFRIVELQNWSFAGREESWRIRANLLLRRIREALGLRLVRGISRVEHAQLLLALGLGMGEFIPAELRQNQVTAGTVHVFAISGMHVGMAALVISLLLRWCGLPLRWQWLLTGLLDGGYVLLTGASASGIRALAMALLVLYARLQWRPPSWLNTLGLAGLGGLVWEPMNIRNLGFVYSYAVVAIILMTGPWMASLREILSERERWLPRGVRPFRRGRAVWWCASGLLVSVLAWMGSAGLSLRVNSRVSLVAPLVNLPLGFLIYVTLMLCPLRILLGFILPQADKVWSGVLEYGIGVTDFLSSCGAESHACLPVCRFAYWQSVLFHLSLIWWLVRCGCAYRTLRHSSGRKESNR